MPVFVTAICDQIKALVLDKLPPDMRPLFVTVHDRWYLGPELAKDVTGEQETSRVLLPAVVLTPVDFTPPEVDAQHRVQRWDQMLNLYFIYQRGPHVSDVERDWAAPLHEALSQTEIHEGLGGLHFDDAKARDVGRVVHFHTKGPADFAVDSENGELYKIQMACFRLKLLAECIMQMAASDETIP